MNDGPSLRKDCPLCTSRRLRYAFSIGERRMTRCGDCRFLFVNPRPPAAPAPAPPNGDAAEHEKSRHFLAQLARYRTAPGGRLLLLGDPASPLKAEAERAGYEVAAGESPDGLEPASYDLCVLWHSLARQGDPAEFLRAAHALLKPGGLLAVATPSLDSWPARTLQQEWPGFGAGQRHFFDTQTLQTALFLTGFERVIVASAQRRMSLAGLARYCERLPRAISRGGVRLLAGLLPRTLRDAERDVPASDMLAFSRAAAPRERRVLSVIIPAFNEASTFEELLQAVLAKEVPGVETEIIVVESNSTDGTRELALKYQDHPRVRLILEDRPRGKGHAVRAGLAQATGDFVLIQDSDLEYDLEDSDALLEPLTAGREAFVLGSRHSGSVWKMRQFSGQASLSAFLNLGHWIFTTLVNVLFRQQLKDPFTMFKVFRRDCLFGLAFECDRFDFDYELLVKLIRTGYRPIELPVNYRSRSFKEGKKVSMIRDPLTWLRVLLRLRLAKIDPLAEVERSQRVATAAQANPAPALVAENALCH